MQIEPQRRAALYAALNRLQSALQGAELWEDERPADRELESEQPFCYDTLMIHQWLQWRFIPRLRAILDQNGKLPESCAIYPYAEDFFDIHDARHGELLRAIQRLDELINAPVARH
jgi:AmpD protein/tRNA pseudouridine65 synthase